MFQWGQSIEDTSGYRIDSLSASVGALNVPVGAEYGRHIWSLGAGDPHWGMKLSQTRLWQVSKRGGGKPPISSF